MRDDFIQRQLRRYYEKLKELRQEQAEADGLLDPVLRASRHDLLRSHVEHIENQIDELMRRV